MTLAGPIYYALIHPHLSFGLHIWGGTYPTYIQKLQHMQNKAFSIISNASHKTSVTPLYKKYGVLKLADLFNYEMTKIMYQFSKQTLPSHLNCLFDPLSTVPERCIRSKTKPNHYIPNFSISRCQNSFTYRNSFELNSSDGRVVRASASGAVDSGLIPSRVKPMTLKLVFTASLLDVQR